MQVQQSGVGESTSTPAQPLSNGYPAGSLAAPAQCLPSLSPGVAPQSCTTPSLYSQQLPLHPQQQQHLQHIQQASVQQTQQAGQGHIPSQGSHGQQSMHALQQQQQQHMSNQQPSLQSQQASFQPQAAAALHPPAAAVQHQSLHPGSQHAAQQVPTPASQLYSTATSPMPQAPAGYPAAGQPDSGPQSQYAPAFFTTPGQTFLPGPQQAAGQQGTTQTMPASAQHNQAAVSHQQVSVLIAVTTTLWLPLIFYFALVLLFSLTRSRFYSSSVPPLSQYGCFPESGRTPFL